MILIRSSCLCTATANDRVVNDLKKQLGENVYISRGPLTRESLHIQVLPLDRKTERYAWLIENLPKIPGTGIIYCLDHRDCDNLADFLSCNGIPALSYYSQEDRDEENNRAITEFQNNRIKAIVATIKLGMGYDKGDVSFVIHFQSPSSVVSWYQQIGRAGRNLKDAYVFLMSGREDDDINEYFIRTAFPAEQEMLNVLEIVRNADGLMEKEIVSQLNMQPARTKKALAFLENEGAIRREYVKERWRYYPTVNKYVFRKAHYQEVSDNRYRELKEMKDIIQTDQCISRFTVNCLDDHTVADCGKCANCTRRDIIDGLSISEEARRKAVEFVSSRLLIIQPRKMYPFGGLIPKEYLLQPGWCLSKYNDPGYGELVAQGKYPKNGGPKRFDDQLVRRAAEVLVPMMKEKGIRHVGFIPSLHSDLVKDFTQRLAQQTGLILVNLLTKSSAKPQKDMQNSKLQYENADKSFAVKDVPVPDKIILVDDVVDSRWTLTACGIKIMKKGCKEVYPFALADSSHTEE